MTFPANKINGSSQPGQHYGAGITYLTISSTVNFLAATATQSTLDKLIEIVSTRTQPIIMGTPYVSPQTGNYVVELAVEHTGAWLAADLVNQIVASQFAGMGFTSANTSVVITQTI